MNSANYNQPTSPTTPMEKLSILLRKTIATSTQDEVAFIYFSKERIDKTVLTARFGTSEIEDDGATYSMTKEKIQFCFRTKTSAITKLGSWTLSIPPCAERTITSVALPSDPVHSMQDAVTVFHIPARAAETVGMTVVHFYSEEEADAFKQRLEISV